jgi:L-asparaginase
MEESAYVLDLTREYDAPVVFTGAQRRPDEPSADGPANILTAVRAAAHERLRDAGGVYVAFDEELHAPRDVIKRHTTALDTFVSPEKGPIASFGRRSVRFHRQPRSYSDTIPTTRTDKRVPVLKSGVGIGSRQSDVAIDEDVDGIVIEGTGVGNTTAELCRTVREAIRNDIPVVVASRCPAGTTEAIYGTEGGGQTLAENGAVHAGDLPAHKARLKLALALADTDEPRMAAEYF